MKKDMISPTKNQRVMNNPHPPGVQARAWKPLARGFYGYIYTFAYKDVRVLLCNFIILSIILAEELIS